MRKYALRKILFAVLAAICCSRLAAQSVPPAALAVFVVSGGNQISEYTTSGALARTLTGGPLGVFRGLAFGADGYLYVTNTFTCPGGSGSCNELERFDPNTGAYLGAVGSVTPNTNPYSGVTNQAVSLEGLALGPGNDLYVLTNQLGLYKIDPAANTTVTIPTANCCTLSVAFLPDGTPLSISSSQNAVTNDFTGAVFNTGSFTSAQSIAFGPDGRLYVLQAQEIDAVPSTGGAITQLSAPSSLSAGYFMAFDSQGHIWATDLNYGVREFDSVTGQQIGGFASNKASAFAGIAIGPVFGNVWAWGDNGFGELGNGTTSASPSPALVSNLSNVVTIADGCCDDEFALALKSDGTVWAWGANGFGELGNGTTVASSTPVQVNGLTGVMAIAANWDHALAVKNDGTVWSWGLNGSGELGNGTQLNSNVPVQVSNLSSVIAVAAGDSESTALRSDGTVWVWGYNGNGQLGIGTTSSAPLTTPVQVNGLSGVVAMTVGNGNSLVLKSDGTVWGWGYNLDGRLGNGTSSSSTTPVQASGLSGVIAIAAGDGVSLALKNDGSVWAWGSGPLGNGTTTGSTIPLQVQSLSGMTAVAAGSNYSLALKSDGTVWAWGNNGSGQLGIGTTSPLTPVTTPVQVNTLSGATAIAAGDIFSLAIEGQANGVATHFSLSATASTTAGTSFNFSLTALDASNHQAVGYLGTVHFTSTDPLAALPVDYTFTAADNGTHSFGATLDTAGSQTIMGTDAANAAITGVSGPVTVSAAAVTQFSVTAPQSVTGGTTFSVTVTARDAFGNTSTSYTGTVHFTSSDALAVLLPDYTFTAADNGTHIFSGLTLSTAGNQTITATDTANAAVTGTSAPLNVVVSLAATHFSVSAPASATTGTAFSVTVTALNAANQTSTSYTGTVVFTSTDPLGILPPIYTFTAADHGTHIFSAVTLNTPGNQTITATDTTNPSIMGTSTTVNIVGPVQINLLESIRVTDGTAILPSAMITVPEAISVTDVALILPSAMITVPEGITVGDMASVLPSTMINVPESISVSDASTLLPALQINVAEDISVVDAQDVQPLGVPTTTSISLPGSISGITYGTPASVTVAVAPSAGSGSVTGNVFLSVDGAAPSSMLLSSGSATFNLGVLNTGGHTLSASFAAQGNFLGSAASATLSIGMAPLTVTANNASKVYGQPNPSLNNVTYSGFVNGDGPASLSGTLSCTATATQASPVGSYPITCSGLTSANYTITFIAGTLTVTPATVTISANGASKVLNAVNPTLSWTATGFANGETASVLTTNPTCATTAATNSPVGSYPITCSGASAANYVFVYVSGSLTIQYSTSVGHVIQPPINANGTSVFKQGRTIPATFNVYDANGAAISTPGVVSSFFLTTIVSGTTTTTIENVVDTNNPDTAFRWDGQEWIFNIATASLSGGSTYIYTITLNDGSTITFQYGLR